MGAGSDSCRVEHGLIGSDASLLPAIFGYVTYRDRMKGQRMGYPLLCLAVPAAPETPDFSLHRHKLREWIRPPREEQRWRDMGIGRRRVLWATDAHGLKNRMDARTLKILADSGLWIQQTGGVLFLARTPRPWRPSWFGRGALGHLVLAAGPVLRVLGHPDTERLAPLRA